MDKSVKNEISTSYKRKSKGDNVSNAGIQTLIDLTDNDKDESLIPILKQQHDLIDLTEPVNVSAMWIVDLTKESTSLQSFPRKHVEIVDLTVDAAGSRMQNVLSLPSVMDLSDDSVDMDVSANKSCGIDLMEQTAERIHEEDSIADSDQGSSVALLNDLTAQLKELQNLISQLEDSEVDFDDEAYSSLVILDNYKQEACAIYEQISQITGETQTFDEEPIEFNGTTFPEFNKKLEEMLNANRMFPCAFDVVKSLECCNHDYSYQLTEDDCFEVAKDALSQIGQEFQKQRSIELKETFSFYTKNMTDPAVADDELQTKLDNNKRTSTSSTINGIL